MYVYFCIKKHLLLYTIIKIIVIHKTLNAFHRDNYFTLTMFTHINVIIDNPTNIVILFNFLRRVLLFLYTLCRI